MEAEASAPPGRPRPWLLGALALAVVLALMSWLAAGKSAAPGPAPSKPRTAARAKTVETVEPGDLDVRLDELKQPRPGTESSDRNPFRFYVKPPPPPPVVPKGEGNGRSGGPPPPAYRVGSDWAARAAAHHAEIHRGPGGSGSRKGGRVQRLPVHDARTRRGNHRRPVSSRAHRRRVSRHGVR